jgi:methylmalonyl-CoA/ethylmalonyl-CoA epimerase
VAKIRHLAISTPDPDAAATFWVDLFGFERAGKLVDHPLADGHFLTDGTLNIAILKFKSQQGDIAPDFVGLHHFGVIVDDTEELVRRAEELGARPLEDIEAVAAAGGFELKFASPDGIVFDIVGRPWTGAKGLDDAS